MSGTGNSIKTEISVVSDRAGGGEDQGVTDNRYEVSFWRDENVLKLDHGDDCTIL